jgi:hypothetical protein
MLRLLCTIGLVALATGVSEETLAEAAAEERARREQAKRQGAPTKVITAEELASSSGRIANDPTVAAAATPEPALATPQAVAGGSVEAESAKLQERETFWRLETRRRQGEVARPNRRCSVPGGGPIPPTRARIGRRVPSRGAMNNDGPRPC